MVTPVSVMKALMRAGRYWVFLSRLWTVVAIDGNAAIDERAPGAPPDV
jgi:hypothetical protein